MLAFPAAGVAPTAPTGLTPPAYAPPANPAAAAAAAAAARTAPKNGGRQQPQPATKQPNYAAQAELAAHLKKLQSNLRARDAVADPYAKAIDEIPSDQLEKLLTMVREAYTADAEACEFMKKEVSVELALQLRDHFTMCCNRCCGSPMSPGIGAANLDAPHARALDASFDADKCSVLHELTGNRGTAVVWIVEILATLPSPCTDPGADPTTAPLTGFCPLMRCVFRHFEAAITQQRGCIALLRLLVASSPSSRAVDNFVRLTMQNLDAMVRDNHANYIVSNLLCNFDARDVDATNAKRGLQTLRNAAAEHHLFVPLERDELLARTPKVLSLSARASNNRGGAPVHPQQAALAPGTNVTPDVIAMVSPLMWRTFVTTVSKYLAERPDVVTTNRSVCHVLENALRRLPFETIPECRLLLSAMLKDLPDRLAPLCHSPWGHHGVQALFDVIHQRPLEAGVEVCQLARRQSEDLLGPQRHTIQSSPYVDKVAALLLRTTQQFAVPAAASGANVI
jgi:hypothetical protein